MSTTTAHPAQPAPAALVARVNLAEPDGKDRA